MDKEQLEEIKQYSRKKYDHRREFLIVPDNDFKRLISTVEEQQKELDLTKADLNVKKAAWEAQGLMIRKLHEENARNREALEFYADRKTWNQEHIKGNEYKVPIALNDEGEKARQALAK